ncbi:MAG TPA: helix-turn-helix domain-containing protein, partial [Streptosporangiaceae bacterium]
MAKRIVSEIRLGHPNYERVDRAEHEEMVREQVLAVLDGLTDRRSPSPAHVDKARLLGERRAEQGLPLEAVIGAYHVGCRELWSAMLVRGRAENPQQAQRLLELVNLLLLWLRVLTGAAADGYAEATRAREEIRTSMGLQFLQALYDGKTETESTVLLARALDFDPNGEFQVICCRPNPRQAKNLDILRGKLRSGTGKFIAIVRETALVIVVQEIPAIRITESLGGDRTVAAGVGLARAGLTGAAESITDAQGALALAERQGGVVDFESDWLRATLLPQIDRLRPLISADQVVTQPHIRDAVRAYAQHGFSITAGAQALSIHPNTMKYRLDRWERLTGFDPRTL